MGPHFHTNFKAGSTAISLNKLKPSVELKKEQSIKEFSAEDLQNVTTKILTAVEKSCPDLAEVKNNWSKIVIVNDSCIKENKASFFVGFLHENYSTLLADEFKRAGLVFKQEAVISKAHYHSCIISLTEPECIKTFKEFFKTSNDSNSNILIEIQARAAAFLKEIQEKNEKNAAKTDSTVLKKLSV